MLPEMLTPVLDKHAEALATVVSIVAALIVGYFGYRANRVRHVREYTLSVLAPLLTNERLFAAHSIVMDHVISKQQLDYAAMSGKDRELVLQLLAYYEFLAAAFLRGDFDRRTVLRQRRSSIKGAWEIAQDFIDTRRRLLGRRVYNEIEDLVTNHCA